MRRRAGGEDEWEERMSGIEWLGGRAGGEDERGGENEQGGENERGGENEWVEKMSRWRG